MAIKAFELFGTIELRDAKLKSGMQSATREFAHFETQAKNHLKGVENSFAKFGSNFNQGFLSSFGIQRGSGVGSLLGSGAGNLLTSGVKALYGHVTDAMERGMEFADQVQMWKIGFTNLLGSEAEGIKHLRELIQYGKESAFETEDVINYAQQLEAVGIKANEVKNALEGIGGALARSGKFNPVALEGSVVAIAQMLGKEKISAEEMQRQLSQYIPNPYGIAARGFNRLGYKTDQGGEFKSSDIRQLGEDNRLNPEAFVRILLDEMRFESQGMLDKVVAKSIKGQKAIREDTKSILFAESMLGGDLMGEPGGAYKQYLENIKKQTQLYSGPESKAIGQKIGGTAETYYGLVGGIEERMFQSDWFTDLLHGDPSGANKKLEQLGRFIPEGLRDGIYNNAKMVIDAADSTLGTNIWQSLETFWETHSPSKKTTQLGLWLAEGLEIGLTKGQSKNYANLKALTQADPNFIKTLAAEAAKRGVNPDDMLNLIGIESSFNKSVMNQYGYGGLGQVGRNERKSLGLPVDDGAFKQMLEANSASWQLQNVLFPFLDMKLRSNRGAMSGGISLAELYAMWGSGHATGDPNAVHMAKGGKRAAAYANNPLWDFNKDGVVRESEFGQAAFASLGAGKYFSVNGQAAVSKTNPMPVTVIDAGNGVDFRSGPSFYDPNYKDSGLTQQINTARGMYTARRGSRGSGSVGTIHDDAPVLLEIRAEVEPLKTSMIMLTDSALMLKKPLDLLGDSATKAVAGLSSVKEQIESEFGPAITPLKEKGKKQKRDRLFDKALTREGIAGDFQGGLQQLLSGLGHDKPANLLKNFGMGLLQDIQGRAAHDVSSMITGALFGTRGEDGKLGGGLLSSLFGGLFGGSKAPAHGGAGTLLAAAGVGGGGGGGFSGFFSKIFGSIFGGFRASGGGMSAGRFYMAGEHGPELITGPGHVYNASQTRQMMSGGPGGREQRFIFVDSEREAQRHRSARADNFIMQWRANRHIISRTA